MDVSRVLAHPRRYAPIAVAALEGGVDRGRLSQLLWAQKEAGKARHSLNQSLYELRRDVAHPILEAAGSRLDLADGVEVDVSRFEEAVDDRPEEAFHLYTGHLLENANPSKSPEFEHWVERQRLRLERVYRRVARQHLNELIEGSEMTAAERACVHWTNVAPLDDEAHEALIRTLAACGRDADAIAHFESYSARIRTELDVEPLEHVTDFVAELRARSPARVPVAKALPSSTDRTSVRHPAVGPALIALAGVVLVFAFLAETRESESSSTPLDPHAIAVLPVEDLTEDGSMGGFALGLTSVLISDLATVSGLTPAPLWSVRQVQPTSPLDSVAQDLATGTIVSAQIDRSGDAVRVGVSLIDGESLALLADTSITRPGSERFLLQDDLATTVARFLRVQLGESVRRIDWRDGTNSERALSLVRQATILRGEAIELGAGSDVDGVARAREMMLSADSVLSEAMEADQEWVEPALRRGRLAWDRALLPGTLADDFDADISRGLTYAAEALARDPSSARALELRGSLRLSLIRTRSHFAPGVQEMLERAISDIRLATAADESLATGWSELSLALFVRGDFAEAREAGQKALERDVYLSEVEAISLRLFHTHLRTADYLSADAACEEGQERFGGYLFDDCRLILMSHPGPGEVDVDAAWGEYQRLLDREASQRGTRSPFHLALVAGALARAGLADSARVVLSNAQESADPLPEGRAMLLYDEARVSLLLGEPDRAVESLAHYLRANPQYKRFVSRDLTFEALRPRSDFQELVASGTS